jgi:Uma2 family endonuclease
MEEVSMERTSMERTLAAGATRLTYEDFLLFPDDGKRHELIDGEHYVTPAPSVRHQRILQHLNRLLDGFAEAHGLGKVFFAPLDVLLSEHDVVEPDLMFISNERASIVTAAHLRGAPDLAVEVLSPSSRRQDEVLKRGLYERAGVDEYWLVDPEAETVKVFRREGARYGRPTLLSAVDGDRLATPKLPGFEAELAAVFAE